MHCAECQAELSDLVLGRYVRDGAVPSEEPARICATHVPMGRDQRLERALRLEALRAAHGRGALVLYAPAIEAP